jgi:sugar/nucleoside kinase (ribokinase family)
MSSLSQRAAKAVDPTGAGDIFLAAYVIGRILKRQTIPDACKYAAKLVAKQIDDNYIQLESLDPVRFDYLNKS